jgi:hypothetical protein
MKVHELIAKLSGLPANLPVRLAAGSTTSTADGILVRQVFFDGGASTLCVLLAADSVQVRSYGENPPDNWHKVFEPAPVCPGCNGREQRWGVRRRRDVMAGAARNEQGDWMGVSAFLLWTGTEDEAKTAARKRNDNPRPDDKGSVFVAEQLTCPRCGKTNRREP